MYELDNSVAARILRRPDRPQLEAELQKYDPAAQKRWVANPAVEWLLQSFIGSIASAPRPAISAKESASQPDKPQNKPPTKEPDSDSGSEGEVGLFGMFD